MKFSFLKMQIPLFLIFLSASFQILQGAQGLSSQDPQKKYDLVICAVFQDETFFMKEWLEYHLLVGVEHFYLYNNLSCDHYAEILQPYIDAQIVELFDWPVETGSQKDYLTQLQLPVYNHALEIAKETTEWAAFIDLDEFLMPITSDSLPALLEEYRSFGGLAINWQIFGTAGLDSLPEEGLILEYLLWKAPVDHTIHQIVKLIVQPRYVKAIKNPHGFEFEPGYYAVDSDKNLQRNCKRGQPVLVDAIQINHYWFGVRDWFLYHKIPRREKWGVFIPESCIDPLIDSFNRVYDDTSLRFVPFLKMRIFEDSRKEELRPLKAIAKLRSAK